MAMLTVGELERRLLERYPASDAELWDRTGLLVGDAHAAVTRVACALDATPDAIAQARDAGANVLLTHHPAFLEPPSSFVCGRASYEASVVMAALSSDVALMNFHTALDVSTDARETLPAMLGLSVEGVLEPVSPGSDKGYGHICRLNAPCALDDIARACVGAFGRMPRIWGASGLSIRTLVTWTGSAGGCERECLARGIDLLICGEVKYHAALAAASQGLALVELGHDASELPFADVLARACVRAGVPSDDAFIIGREDSWHTL
ncbi:Nif3-like dinuclear metal center hexameric protein [Slackia exigua]|uniref:Nif3-like dinuclear metal center hexameric protein n=2 Tax=Slackia exigua TaxID=84109 RepID=UPI00254F2D09|nr:Nif3-like dinuclear metal center hexameric protein [Slackia exigua]MDK7723660.1 Nif3-like dinuclear metal center hexameric protein [Slackia exigua]MDK7725826.1 Nif3-like dinuclear metal center hexameric protein [Slackia exigua]